MLDEVLKNNSLQRDATFSAIEFTGETHTADELEAVEDEEVEFEDDEIVTHTNIPVLAGESTSPTPKTTLPRRRG